VPEQTFGAFTVSGLQLSRYHGRVYNVPVSVRLGSEAIDLGEFLQAPASDTVSARYEQDPGAISTETPFGYATATRGQSRIQVDAKTRTKLPVAVFKTLTFSTEHRYRWYRHDAADTGLFTERHLRTQLALELGIGKRWSIGPSVERTDVAVGAGRTDLRLSIVRWSAQVRVPLFWNGRSIE
jgi:hypothetical protein